MKSRISDSIARSASGARVPAVVRVLAALTAGPSPRPRALLDHASPRSAAAPADARVVARRRPRVLQPGVEPPYVSRAARSPVSLSAGRAREQREGDVQHVVERACGDALARLVVALGAIGEVDDAHALGDQRVRVGGAAADNALRAKAAVRQRALGDAQRERAGRMAVAGEHPLHADVDVAFTFGRVRRLVDAIYDLRGDLLGSLVAHAPRLRDDRAALGHDV